MNKKKSYVRIFSSSINSHIYAYEWENKTNNTFLFSGKKSNNQIKNILFGISKSVAFSPSSWYVNFKLSEKKMKYPNFFN